MPITIMAKNYSHCPLKKRPVYVSTDCVDEPENLSTKPEDLSRNGNSVPSPSLLHVSSSYSPSISPASSPAASSLISSPSPPHNLYSIKSEPHLLYNSRINPEYAPQTWHRSVTPLYYTSTYHFVPYSFHSSEYISVGPSSSYNDSSYSPSHEQQQPLTPLSLHSNVYSPLDQSSLSPNSSSASPPPSLIVEDLSEKRRQSIRHQCTECGKSYSTFSGLSKHRQFHCAAGEGPKKSFSCKYCEKVYVSLGALKMHIRTHTLPCKCTICGKAFSRPWLLQGHIRTHTGEKPFSCTYCNRAFADRSNLRAHLQTHSDVKKYSCLSCNKTFSRMSLLSKHNEAGCNAGSTIIQNDKLY